MIRKVRGNLLEADAEALVNTVNTVGVMGRGVALQFKRAFPANYKAYRKICEKGELEPGGLFTFDLNRLENPKYVINFATKRHWRQKSKLEYIDKGLQALVKEVSRLNINSIALPPLGSGLGGLNWKDVYQRIEEFLSDLPDVQVLVYEPSGAPAPEKMPTRTTRPNMTASPAALLSLMKLYLEPLMDDAVTLLEIHKLMYFIQEAGEPLKLDYVKGAYGPYARNLHHVLDRIEGHFIVGYGEGTEAPGKTIEYKKEAVEEAEKEIGKRPVSKERLARVENLIRGFETPYGMELLASVHWVAHKEDKSGAKDPEVVVARVHEWNDRKRKLFPSSHIQSAWHHLSSLGWLG